MPQSTCHRVNTKRVSSPICLDRHFLPCATFDRRLIPLSVASTHRLHSLPWGLQRAAISAFHFSQCRWHCHVFFPRVLDLSFSLSQCFVRCRLVSVRSGQGQVLQDILQHGNNMGTCVEFKTVPRQGRIGVIPQLKRMKFITVSQCLGPNQPRPSKTLRLHPQTIPDNQ